LYILIDKKFKILINSKKHVILINFE